MTMLTDPKIFNYAIMAMYVANAGRWALYGSWGDVAYWAGAAWITAAVTWGYAR